MRKCLRTTYSMAQRQMVEPELATVEPYQDRFKVSSPTFEFVIEKKPPSQPLIYSHQADTPASLLTRSAIHVFPASLPALNRSEKMASAARQLDRKYENAFRNCKGGKEIFHLQRKIKAEIRTRLSFIGTLSGRHQHMLSFQSILDAQAGRTQSEYEKKGVAVEALGERVYPLGKVWLPTSQRYLHHYLDVLRGIPSKPYNVLDLGCGCGILGFLFAKNHRKSRVVGIDKNPSAVNTTNVNAARMRFENVQAIEFDMADYKQFQLKTQEAQLPAAFDWVTLNPPWLPAARLPGESIISEGIYDQDSHMLHNSLQLIKQLLAPQGRVVVIYSDLAALIGLAARTVEDLARENGFEVVSRDEFPLVEGLPKKSALQEFKSRAQILTYVLRHA